MVVIDESPLAVVAKFQNQVPVDLVAIAAALGVPVVHTPLGREIAGQITRDPRKGGRSGFVIHINSSEHPNRQRFTLAHEIAHFILHRDLIESGLIDDTMYRSDLGDRYESQANRLAADILMPVRQVRKYLNTGMAVEALAQLFKVSAAAMKIRVDGMARTAHQGELF